MNGNYFGYGSFTYTTATDGTDPQCLSAGTEPVGYVAALPDAHGSFVLSRLT